MRLFCGFLIFWFSLLLLPVRGWGQYIVDFEGSGETKTAYASGTVNLSGLDWNMTEALIGGGEPADWKNGARSARMRGYGTSSMTMLDDKPNGVGMISFQYRRYGTDAQVDWKVEYSTNGGLSWTQVGSDFTAPASDDVQTFSETIDIPGNIRVRIKRATETGTANRRLNIDDIIITDYKFEVIDFDDNSNWTAGSGGIISYQTDHAYEDQGWLFTGGQALRETTSDQDGFPAALGTYSWRLRDEAGTDWRARYDSRGIIEAIGFDIRRWDDSPNPNWSVEYSTNGGSTFLSAIITINNDFLDNSSDWKTVYHIFPEPLQVNEGEFVLRFLRIGGERIMVDNFSFKLQQCSGTEVDFRTVTSGSWFEASNWELSDGTEWGPSFCIPGVNASTVQVDHFMEVNKEISLSNVTINSGGHISVLSNKLRLSGDQAIVIESGGVMSFDAGSGIPEFDTDATVVVKGNGIIRVNNPISGISGDLAGNNSSGKLFYEDGSVFEWNNNSLFQVSGQTYFPDVVENIIPIFRITSNISSSLGGGSGLIVHGLFTANGNLSFSGTGQYNFRNGITGSGNVTQATNSGTFIIDGSTAQIGGTGQLILNNNGLEISSENAELVSDKTITGGPVKLSGKLLGGYELTLSLGGDFIIEDTGEFEHQNSTLVFNGSGPQNFHSTAPVELQKMTMNNSSGLQINTDITVIENLSMQAGNIDMEGNILEIGIDHESTSSLNHESGQIVNGWLKRWFDSSVNSAEEGFFPIGLETSLNDATVEFTTPPSTTGSLMARFYPGLPENYYNGLPFTADGITFNTIGEYGYWEIITEPVNGLTGGKYTLSLNAAGFGGIEEPSLIRILKRENQDHLWTLDGEFDSHADNIFVHSGMNGFSEFVISSNFSQNPLPIELIHFTAEAWDRQVDISWATASEINNDFFTLERTTNMREIEIIGRKPGAGNSNTVLRYGYTDRDPHPGISYYRLKQTDFDGSYEYSDWIAVRVNPSAGNELEILRLFRQHDSVFLLLQTQPHSNLEIRVADIYGREIHHGRLQSASETARYSFLSRTSGLIFITVSDGQKRVSGRMIYSQGN